MACNILRIIRSFFGLPGRDSIPPSLPPKVDDDLSEEDKEDIIEEEILEPKPQVYSMRPCIAIKPITTRAKGTRSWLLTEPCPVPLTCPLTPELIREVIAWADVENVYRWDAAPGRTYCNIYAADILHILGAYLPRQWWKKPKDVDASTEIEYGVNTREMNANSLHDWLLEYGKEFGWKVSGVPHELGESCVEVAIARRKDRSRSGHVILRFKDGASQAGTTNKEWFPLKEAEMHAGSTYDSVVYAVMSPTSAPVSDLIA